MRELTLKTGRVVRTGLIPATRAQVNRFRCVRFKDSLAPPPAVWYSGQSVDFFTMGGNGPELPDDTSYNGPSYGDCVPTFLANAKRALSTNTGGAEVKIEAATIVAWYLNATGGQDSGMNIADAMTLLQTVGMQDVNGVMHYAGPNAAIDWTNQTEMQYGLSLFEVVALGLAAAQLQQAVGDTPGWLLQGARVDKDVDHCIPALGYGSIEPLAALMKVPVPSDANDTDFYWAVETWGQTGFIEAQSLQNIMVEGEAHVFVTDPDRADSATWNPIAEADWAQITGTTPPINPPPVNPPPPINPPTPRPRPCPRIQAFLDSHPDLKQPLWEALSDDLFPIG